MASDYAHSSDGTWSTGPRQMVGSKPCAGRAAQRFVLSEAGEAANSTAVLNHFRWLIPSTWITQRAHIANAIVVASAMQPKHPVGDR